MEIVTVSFIALGLLVLMLSFGVPLPFCFGGALMTMVGLGGATMKGTMVWGFSQLANPVLLCIPLFVFAGTLMSESGIAASLLRFVNVFVGRIRGGLGVVATVSCAIIGAISGSGLTGVAATGPILIPEMDSKGYPRGYATALVANSSILGLLIPPSVTMIIYGWVTDTSILACFLATMGPGLLITFLFSVVNMVLSRKFPLVLDPPKPVEETVRQGVSLTSKAIPALVMPLIILGGIYGGIMTPTEAAAVAVIYALPVGFLVYRGLTFDTFFKAAKNSATSVGAIMVMIVFSLMLSQIFVMEDVPQALVDGIFTVTQNKVLLLILINFLLFFVGMIVNDITAIILLAPLLLPLMGAIGVSPVQFAAIMGVNTAMGGVTPPYASILYLGMRIGKVEFSEVIKPAMILIIFGYVPVVFLTSLWPKLSLFIPGLFGY
ncbi:TRAP transporter large permease [Desulfoluna butyratoxydans]|uniref:Trap c4-dicarboxylate transport system permease dctm subunit n=1 Tax=Desulfoluna butyratoxydans TaxID=231438 RepID=A0A4V6ILZ3_9BACT|nr:TRAP transporter large permease [Desulfoluna butyratoxydans]VFQ46848.1 trap c4-dicarboxylate transport system permease dctm subunit [Desulfoluna butyratoxydans]